MNLFNFCSQHDGEWSHSFWAPSTERHTVTAYFPPFVSRWETPSCWQCIQLETRISVVWSYRKTTVINWFALAPTRRGGAQLPGDFRISMVPPSDWHGRAGSRAAVSLPGKGIGPLRAHWPEAGEMWVWGLKREPSGARSCLYAVFCAAHRTIWGGLPAYWALRLKHSASAGCQVFVVLELPEMKELPGKWVF